MAETNGVRFGEVSLPKGGGAYAGLGEDFQLDLFSGGAGFSLPLPVTETGGLEPRLTLCYRATEGNGPFGLGFSLDLPFIGRLTTRRVPRYDDTDIFHSTIYGELTQGPDGFLPVSASAPVRLRQVAGGWRAEAGDGMVWYYGGSPDSVIPGPGGVPFRWLLREAADPKGNRISYRYESCGSNRYLASVRYGNSPGPKEAWSFELVFRYEEGRDDAFESFKGGFSLLTDRLCTSVEVIHHLYDPRPVRRIRFSYDTGPVSLLREITCDGLDYGLDGETCRTLPPIRLDYCNFSPAKGPFRPVEADMSPLPLAFSAGYLRPFDLYGEGVAGLLYADGVTNLYYPPMGEGRYGSPEAVESFPIHRDLSACLLTSLDGDGRRDLVSRRPEQAGYYRLEDSGWSSFTPFPFWPNRAMSSEAEWADLEGNAKEHLLESGGEGLRYYPSLGREGMGPPVERAVPEGFPPSAVSGPECLVTFADLFGDGMMHRVRVTDGVVECWPNLGYGRFGVRRVIPGLPRVEGFDAGRVFFADVDGSGAQSLIYAHPDRLDVYLNQAGRRFLPPFSVTLPTLFTDRDRLSFADVSGSGCTGAVFVHVGKETTSWWLDFCGGEKPYLLSDIRSGSRHTEIKFKSSAIQYLQDRAKGILWASRPPFPVQVVSSVTITDGVSRGKTVSRYQCRHGYFDSQERQFMGFGYVEEERREELPGLPKQPDGTLIRHWFLTGRQGESYRTEYGVQGEYVLPPPALKGGGLEGAWLALRGKPLRREIWRLPRSGPRRSHPLGCEGYTYSVETLQNPERGHKGSFRVLDREHITWRYEETEDPRVEHSYGLEYDGDGFPLRELTVYEPRRFPECPEQGEARVVLRTSCYAVPAEGWSPRGLPWEQSAAELVGVKVPEGGGDFAWAHSLTVPGRLLSRERSFYWDIGLAAPLPQGMTGPHGLSHHIETMMFPLTITDEYPQLREGILIEDCGLLKREDGWYRPGMTAYYDPTIHFRPVAEDFPCLGREHALYRRTELVYDPYGLLVVEKLRWSEKGGLRDRFWPDYRTMSLTRWQDPNGNMTEALLDELGLTVATARHAGTVESPLKGFVRRPGDVAGILADKAGYLQGADAFYYYAYPDSDLQPNVCVTLKNTLPDGVLPESGDQISCCVVYTDSGGRKVSEKEQCEEGFCEKARIFYDGEGHEVALGRPRFTAGADFEPSKQGEAVEFRCYDPLGRHVRTDRPSLPLPNGSVSTVTQETRYGSWRTELYDENDLALETPYYREFLAQYPSAPSQELQDAKDGLDKGVLFAGTPTVTELDVLGYPAQEFAAGQSAVTRTFHPDGTPLMVRSRDGHSVLRYRRSMDGGDFCTESSDGGRTLRLSSAHGETVHTFDEAGVHLKIIYDHLGRVLETRRDGKILSRMVYGEQAPDAEHNNLMGGVWKQYGQDGERVIHCRDLRSNPVRATLRLSLAWTEEPDWAADPPLEEEIHAEQVLYDRLGRPVFRVDPGGYESAYIYNLRGGLSEFRGAGTSCRFTYSPAGLETTAIYGSGVRREAAYDPATLWLTSVRSWDGAGRPLQDLRYHYDLHGNLTRVRDALAARVYNQNHPVDGLLDYTYDERYQLIRAEGRELPEGAGEDLSRLERYVEEYIYDGLGNISKTVHRAPSTLWSRTCEVDADSNHLVKWDKMDVQYDACGRPVVIPGMGTLAWDAAGRLLGVEQVARVDGSDGEFYHYGLDGVRTRKVTIRRTAGGGVERCETLTIGGGCERRRKWLGERLVLDRTCQRLAGPGGRPCAVRYDWRVGSSTGGETEAVRYQLCDHRHSVTVETDETGAVTAAEEYYPYGGSAVRFGNPLRRAAKVHRYCGWERDGATGLYCYGARYYSAVWGRFLTPDAQEYVNPLVTGSLNPYAYCRGNPVSLLDPDGHDITILYDGYGLMEAPISEMVLRLDMLKNDKFEGENISYVPFVDIESAKDAWGKLAKGAKRGHTVIWISHGVGAAGDGLEKGNPIVGSQPLILNELSENRNITEVLMISCFGASVPAGGKPPPAETFRTKIAPRGVVGASTGLIITKSGESPIVTEKNVGVLGFTEGLQLFTDIDFSHGQAQFNAQAVLAKQGTPGRCYHFPVLIREFIEAAQELRGEGGSTGHILPLHPRPSVEQAA